MPRWAVSTLQDKPTRVWIGLQDIARVNTTTQLVNHIIFDNCDVIKTRVLLNCKFATQEYVRAYHDF
jgi:hypothetical protein